jgi:hypothetical protein
MPNEIEINQDEVPDEFSCVGCQEVHESENLGFEGSHGSVCKNCARVCPDCSKDFNLNSGSGHAYHGGDYYCYKCTRDDFRLCNNCDEYERSGDFLTVASGNDYCSDCVSNSWHFCDTCREYISDSDYDHEDECGTHHLIHSYDYTPDLNFNHTVSEFLDAKVISTNGSIIRKYKQIGYLGFELEVEANGSGKNHGAGLFENDEDIVYLKQDGSIHNGFEIVTHPMTLDWAMEHFPWQRLDELSSLGFEGYGCDNVGVHVHVSRDGFLNESHQSRFVHFVIRNESFLCALAGRSNNSYAYFDRDALRGMSKKLRRTVSTPKYSAVNVLHKHTLEVRIFKSSVKVERVKMYLQLVDAIRLYTENMSCKDMISGNSLSADSFVKWTENQDKYEILNSYINKFRADGQVGE